MATSGTLYESCGQRDIGGYSFMGKESDTTRKQTISLPRYKHGDHSGPGRGGV